MFTILGRTIQPTIDQQQATVAMKDDHSFVSFGATFKPDDASSIATSSTERNWNTVYAEAITVPHEADIHVVTAQPVAIDQEAVGPVVATTPSQVESTSEPASTMQRCNCLVIVIGYAHMIMAVSAAFGTELASVAIYCVGVGFHWLAEMFKKGGSFLFPFQALFRMLSGLMLWLDLMVLSIGIFMVELIAWIALALCILFGGLAAGSGWHQHIRKVCHLTRWTFRGFHSSWEPKRLQPGSKTNTAPAKEVPVEAHIETDVKYEADYVITDDQKKEEC